MRLLDPRRLSLALAPSLAALALCASADAQALLTKFYGEDTSDYLGSSVAIFGDVAVLGAPNAHGSAFSGDGAAYVVRRSPSGWPSLISHPGVTEIAPTASVYNETFGSSVAIHGALIAVGQPEFNSSATVIDNGAVHVFRDTAAGVVLEADLVPSASTNSRAGEAVAAFQGRVAVGAPSDFSMPTSPGEVYIYLRSPAAPHWGGPEAALIAPGGAVGDRFGFSVALEGSRCIVGAPGRASLGANTGAAYVFVRSGGVWMLEAELAPLAPVAGSYFGVGVDILGDYAVVGAHQEDAVYVFHRSATSGWEQIQRLAGPDSTAIESFGRSVALNSDRLAVGASSANTVHVFQRQSPLEYRMKQRFHERYTDALGFSVDLSGEDLLAGAPLDGDAGTSAGATHFFASPTFVAMVGFGAEGLCPCSNDDPLAGCRNSTGFGARLVARGSDSLIAGDMQLEVSRLPAGRQTLVIMGDGVGAAVLGAGRRVVFPGAEGFARLLPGGMSTAAGEYVLGPNLGVIRPAFAARVSAGETWRFQCWHRDSAHGACTAGLNLSNALEITFAH